MSNKSPTNLQEAYKQTNFEIISSHPNLEVPTSTPAVFTTANEIDVGQLQNKLTRNKYSFIAPFREQTYLSSKVYDPVTNEFFHVKAHTGMIRIFPKSEEFSFETFERVVTTIETELTGLELVEDDDLDSGKPRTRGPMNSPDSSTDGTECNE